MAVIEWSSVFRTWDPSHCEDVRPFEALLNSELKRVFRAADPNPVCAWSGPMTDRARLELRQVQAADFPVTLRFVLGCVTGDTSEEWTRLTGAVTLANANEAAAWRPLGATGGILTRRWTLRASLDPVGAAESVQGVFVLVVDRGVAPCPAFSVLATGVAP